MCVLLYVYYIHINGVCEFQTNNKKANTLHIHTWTFERPQKWETPKNVSVFERENGFDDDDDDIHLIRGSNKLNTEFYDIRKHWTASERWWTEFCDTYTYAGEKKKHKNNSNSVTSSRRKQKLISRVSMYVHQLVYFNSNKIINLSSTNFHLVSKYWLNCLLNTRSTGGSVLHWQYQKFITCSWLSSTILRDHS